MNTQTKQNIQVNTKFIQMPMELFLLPQYCKLSVQARVLYALMYDRSRLSGFNGWIDEQGRVYIYFTVKEIIAKLNCGHTTAVKLLDELDVNGGAGLIRRKKQGLGKPSMIYVEKISSDEEADFFCQTDCFRNDEYCDFENENFEFENSEIQNSEIRNSVPERFRNEELSDSEIQTYLSGCFRNTEPDNSENGNSLCSDDGTTEVQNTESNHNDISHNNINHNDLNHIISHHIREDININNGKSPTTSGSRFDEMNTFREIIKTNIGYDAAVHTFGEEWTDGIVELMTDVVCSPRKFIRINRDDYPKEVVKDRFLKIRYPHIENVYFTTHKVSGAISNIRSYLITTIYRSFETSDNWMSAKANFDMSTW